MRHQAPMKKQAYRNKLTANLKCANVEKLKKKKKKKKKKNVGSCTPTIAPIKQTEKSLGPVDSVFLIIF